MAGERLEAVLAAWELTPHLHRPRPPASLADMEEVQHRLGRRLPQALFDLYATAGGGQFVRGNLMLHPPLPEAKDDLALATASDLMREWEWPIPDELVMIGDNGGDEQFGIWIPADGGDARPIVVEVGEVFEERCLAIVGDDFESFVMGWTAYYLLLTDEHGAQTALQRLGVPEHMRALPGDGSDEEFEAFLRWASPRLPGRPDPYAHGLTPDEVAAVARD